MVASINDDMGKFKLQSLQNIKQIFRTNALSIKN